MSNPFVPALLIICLGMLARWRRVLPEGSGAILSRIILNITLPALVLTTMSRAQLPGTALALPVLAIGWGLMMLLTARLLFARLPRNTGGVLALSLLGFNIGQFAYPLVEGAWGADALALLVMFDIGNAIVVFGIAYTLAGLWSGRAANIGAIFRRLVTFVPLLSYIAALAMNLTGFTLPRLLALPLETLAAANGGLVMLLVGLYLKPGVIWRRFREVARIVAIRYGFGLAAGLVVWYLLPAPELVRAVLVATFLLPVGMSVIPYTLEHDWDADLAGALLNATIIISFGLLWLVFAVLG